MKLFQRKYIPFSLGITGFIAMCFVFLLNISLTHATAFTWDGGGTSDNWSDCVNWVGDACPGAGDTVVFDATSAASAHNNSTIDAGFGASIGGITLATGYTGTVTQGTTFTINSGGFTESSTTATWAGGTSALTISGPFAFTAGAYTPTSGTWSMNGDFSMTGGAMAGAGKTMVATNGMTTFTYTAGTGNFNTDTSAAVTMSTNNLTVKTIKAGTTLTATIAGGTSVTVESGASLTTIGDTLFIAFINNGSFTNGSGFFHAMQSAAFNGTTNNLSSATGNMQVGVQFSPAGALSVGSGAVLSLNAAVTTINIGANYDNQGTFDITGRTLEFDTNYASGEITHYHDAVSTGNFNVLTGASVIIAKNGGTFTVLANQTIAASVANIPLITIDALGTLNTTGDVRTHRFINNGNFTMSTAGFFHAERGATFAGATNDLSNATDMQVGLAYNPPEDLVISSGKTVTFGGTDISVGANFTNNGSLVSTASVTFTTGWASSIVTTSEPFGGNFIVNKTSGYGVTLAQNTVVNGGVTITAGTLDVTAFNYNLTVGGNWSNSATFTPRAGTVTLNGTNQSITGNTTFYNLTKTVTVARTLTFAASSTTTISNTLTLQGTVGNRLSLRSSVPTTQVNIDPQGTRVLASLDVQDNTNTNVTVASCIDDCFDSARNTNWLISAAVPGVTIVESGFSTDVTEGGATDTYTAVLDKLPTANVVVTPTGNADVSVSGALTFTTLNWDTPQTITVTAINDLIDETSPEDATITHAVTSTDLGYNGLAVASVTAHVTDDDTAGVTVGGISGHTTELLGTATFTVVLDTQPTADVSIGVTSDNTAEGTVSASSLTFTSVNWATPQTITVTGVNDFVDDGDITYHAVLATASSVDPFYNVINPADVTVINDDNDTAGVTVGAISGHTTELLGTATFTVVLDSQPTASVSIGISSDDATEGTVLPASITFTTGNWATPQTVTVTGVNDAMADGDITYHIILATASSADLLYNVINPADVTVINDDNDNAGVTVSLISGHTTELLGAATFTVVLDTQPTADVTIGVTSDNTAEGTVSASSLTFTDVNWATPQTVTATGVNDFVDDGNVTYHAVLATTSSADLLYNVINPTDVTVINDDNDTAGVTVGGISGHTTELLGTATFTVVLDTQPTADVSIGVTSDNTAEGTVSASSLTFTSVNWATPQTITVTGVNDFVDDGDITYHAVLATASSADLVYNVINPADVTIINDDNDTVGVTVTESGGTTDVTEGGVLDSYTIVLLTEPVADVTVSLTPDVQVTVDFPSVIFTSLNWNTPRTITVTAENDRVVEGAHTGTITHVASSADPLYSGLAVASVVANITDNDSAGSSGYSSPQNVLHPPSIAISTPTEGDAILGGQSYLITWTAEGTNTDFVNLYYSTNGGVDYNVIERNVRNAGSYSWDIPLINTSEALVKVTATDLAVEVVSDVSGIFSIYLPSEPEVETPTLPVYGPSPVDESQELISPVEVGYLIRSPFYSTVYQIVSGFIRRPFFDAQTFFTYQTTFNNVQRVTDATLPFLTLGSPMLPKSGVVLVKTQVSPRVYAVGDEQLLHAIPDEDTAAHLYGSNWADYVIDIPPTLMEEFTMGEPMTGDEIIDRSILRRRVDLHAE